MKKILFCLQTMVCGGVEKELLTILNRFDPQEYSLSVLLFYEQDMEIQNKIPSNVPIINLNVERQYYCSGLSQMVKSRLKHGNITEAFRIILNRAVFHIPISALIDISGLPDVDDTYDFAVCYHMHSPVVLRYVAEKVKSKYKVAWIHNDFSTTHYAVGKYEKWLSQYDRIVGVSDQLSNEFKLYCPQLSEKVITVHNIVDSKEIRDKAADLSNVDKAFLHDDRTRIVTVGRFVEQKGFDIAIDTCKLLRERGFDLTWYAIGYGKDEENLIKMINDRGLKNDFIILGRKDNPYPYIALADIYVQPSRHEGFALTVVEAKALKKLIVCTNFAGAKEQIESGVNGIVTDSSNPEELANAIEKVLNDSEFQNTLNMNIVDAKNIDGWYQIEGVFKSV